MRSFRTAVLVALTALAVASLPGCGGDSPGSPETAGATTRAPAPSTSGAPTSPAPATTPGGIEAMLSDTGLGDLKLNITLKKARTLGWVGKADYVTDDHVCDMYHGKRGADLLYFTHGRLVIIAVGPKIKLDTGIGVGSTYTELHGAYGDLLGSDDGLNGGGRVYIEAPGAPFRAQYRIGIDTDASLRDSKVTEIALQSVDLGCYE